MARKWPYCFQGHLAFPFRATRGLFSPFGLRLGSKQESEWPRTVSCLISSWRGKRRRGSQFKSTKPGCGPRQTSRKRSRRDKTVLNHHRSHQTRAPKEQQKNKLNQFMIHFFPLQNWLSSAAQKSISIPFLVLRCYVTTLIPARSAAPLDERSGSRQECASTPWLQSYPLTPRSTFVQYICHFTNGEGSYFFCCCC